MSDMGFEVAKHAFYVSRGRFAEAAAIDLEEGNLQSAVELFTRAGDRNSKLSAVRCLVDLLSAALPLGCSDDWTTADFNSESAAKKYIRDANSLLRSISEGFEDELSIKTQVS